MTTYKLTYFNFRGAAETTRHLFAVAEQEYEDIRIEKHQWAKLKPGKIYWTQGSVDFVKVQGVSNSRLTLRE